MILILGFLIPEQTSVVVVLAMAVAPMRLLFFPPAGARSEKNFFFFKSPCNSNPSSLSLDLALLALFFYD